MTDRIQLNDQETEEVVGGAFNWYYANGGLLMCYVDGIGEFKCGAKAHDRLNALRLEHKQDRWTAAQYVEILQQEGLFY